MKKIYQHINCEERAVIMINDRQGVKAAEIARILGRDRSSLTRELCHQPKGQYCATKGAELHRQRKALSIKPKKIISNEKLSDKVNAMIRDRQWSPEQISETLKLDYPDDPSMHLAMKQFIGISMQCPQMS